jgi:hypothetical protein
VVRKVLFNNKMHWRRNSNILIDAKLETVKREPPKEQGEAQFDIPVGQAAIDSVDELLRLKGLRHKVDAAKLGGLLVLWQPGL